MATRRNSGFGLRAFGALALLAGLALCRPAAAASCVAPPTGLVGWWTGDGTAGDSIGLDDGTLVGGASASAPGMVGSAFHFDGTNGFVEIPDSPVLDPSNLTIEAWVRFDSLDSQGSGGSPPGEQYIVFKQNSRTIYFEGFELGKDRGPNGDYFLFSVCSAAGQLVETHSVTLVSTGVWYHVAGVRGPNFIQIYVNGQLESQLGVGFPQDYGTLPLYFGTSGEPYWDHKFKGSLDEVSLYNRALSSNEIAAIYAADSAGKCRGPVIVEQPQSRTVAVGTDVSFSVLAAGTAPLSYRWQRDGTDLASGGNVSGADTAMLSLTGVQTNDSAGFRVIVSNLLGAITSEVAVLTVESNLVGPSILSPPASQTVVVGTNAVFSVIASGSNPLSYQWRFNGTPLTDGGEFTGTTTAALGINFVVPADAGGYSVVVTNTTGAVTSGVATLTVSLLTNCLTPLPGLIGWWPGDGNANDIVGTNSGILEGGATADVPGMTGLAFTFDGTNKYVQIPDAPELKPAELTVECWVKFDDLNAPGTSVYVGQQYLVFKQNSRYDNFEGYVLSKDRTWADIILWEVTSASGQLMRIDSTSPVTTNVWYHLAGVRGSNYIALYFNGVLEARTNVAFPQDYGNWPLYFGTSGQAYWDRRLHGELDEVLLYNRALSSNEIFACYAVGAAGKCKAPSITAEPQGGRRYWGGNITFSGAAIGDRPLGYEWRKDNVPVSGATNTSLTLSNLHLSDAGNYWLRATNVYGEASSLPALLQMSVADVTIDLARQGGQTVPGLNIAGTEGQVYGVQYVPQFGLSNHWIGLTNLTLTGPTNSWFDPQPATEPQRYYRVVPGPIPVP